MAVKSTGSLGLENDIVGEFGGTAPHQITEYYRGGGLVDDNSTNASIPTSGEVALGDFYGAANVATINLTLSSNTNNYDVYTAATANPAYVAGASQINVTVNPGVTVGSTSTSTYAMQIPSAFNPADVVTITNNGTIVGRGGNGGDGSFNPINNPPAGNGNPGAAGGHALYINRPVSITNNGTIAGGGGGGGASGGADVAVDRNPKSGVVTVPYGGCGGGGGAGVNAGSGGAGGPAQSPPTARRNGNAGSAGTATSGGAGGPQIYNNYPIHPSYVGAGGSGGNLGSSGSAGVLPYNPTGPGGNYTMTKGTPGSGGAAGRYITGNSFATWVANGTRLGGSS